MNLMSASRAPRMSSSMLILKDSLLSTLTTITVIVHNSYVANTFAPVWKTAEVKPIT